MDRELKYYYNLYMHMRLDDDDDDSKKGASLKYRLPYALCKQKGINAEGMTPREAWNALWDKDCTDGNYMFWRINRNRKLKGHGVSSVGFNATESTKCLKPTKMDTSIKTLKNLSKAQDGFRKLKDNDYARAIYQETTEEERKLLQKNLKQMFDDNDFCRNVGVKRLGLMLTQGFKNQFQTKRSAGSYSPNTRRFASDRLFGTGYKVEPSEYEKYGYLGKIGDYEACFGYNLEHYGDVTVCFKKDIRNRTTYTLGDSLNGEAPAGCVGDNPTLDGMAHALHSNINGDYVKGLKKDLDKYKNPIDPKQFVKNYSYVELQYHGDVGASDIDRIQFRDKEAARTALGTMSKKARKTIQDNGIKIGYFDDNKKYVEVDDIENL